MQLALVYQKLLKNDLGTLKLDVDKLEIDKLITTPLDLRNLSNVVANDVVKNMTYDELVKKLLLFRLFILVI